MMTRREKAMSLFEEGGYNCAQSVLLAFSDILPVDEAVLSRMAAPFGGGMGRLREMCGACSAMYMVLGLVTGYEGAGTRELKGELYARVQEVAAAFREKNGSYLCRELLGLSDPHDSPMPEARTPAYYAQRPCRELVGDAAEILEDYLKKNKK